MCRWMAWHGQPVLIDELLFKTQHGIVDQSLHSRMGAEPTNGDGVGVGWYGGGEGPAVYHSVAPAWGDANLRELAAHVESPLFLVHVRAAIGSPVQQTNCHPFRHGRWLFVHNGYVGDFEVIRRDLMWAIDPKLFAGIVGSTDTEVVFRLALTFGLEEDPIGALERTVGLIETTATECGVAPMVQGTFGVSDGSSRGRCGTRPKARRGPSSRRPTSTRCTRCTPTRKCGSQRRRPTTGLSRPSRSRTCPACGTRSTSRPP